MSDLSALAQATHTPPSPYLLLKQARALFQTSPEQLDAAQRRKLDIVVARQRQIESRILGSRQAGHVVVSEDAITRSVAEISGRFESEAEFICDLARTGLSLEALRGEVARELRVEAVLEMVSSKVAPVSNVDSELFYRLHAERFKVPERRSLRHILITHNDSEQDRHKARARIEALRQLLLVQPERFGEQALRHSECPTAMQGGLLGQIQRDQLFPSLDAAAFTMRPGSLSEVLESPMGFHILRCENIQPAHMLPLAQVRERIRGQMLETRRQNKQRAWISRIMQSEG